MGATIVKELMVPIDEYATVSEDASLKEAVETLLKSQEEYDQTKYRHRAILIYGKDKRIIGKVSLYSIFIGLDSKYDQLLTDKGPADRSFTHKYQKTLIRQMIFMEEPLGRLCEIAAPKKVKRLMYPINEGDIIDAEANLNKAIHQLVLGHHQSLLVREENEIVGILRLSDVLDIVGKTIVGCKIPPSNSTESA